MQQLSGAQYEYYIHMCIDTIPSECCPVNLLMSVLLPTDGNPIKPTLATPVLATSKPASNY